MRGRRLRPRTNRTAFFRAPPALNYRQTSTNGAVMTSAMRAAPQSDHDILLALNRDYIDSVQRSDVKRFDEILAPEFYCSNPDGTLVDRAGFLQQTARPVTIKGLEAKD